MSDTIFPPELFLDILARVPAKADLLSFRLINKNIGALVTRQAFNTIKVTFDKKKALGFIALQNSDLAKHVEKVEFLGGQGSDINFYDDDECDYGYYSDTDYSPGIVKAFRLVRVRKHKTAAALLRGFSGLGKLPSLRQLTLDFFDRFRENHWEGEEDPENCASLSLLFQRHLLKVIAQNIQKSSLASFTSLKLLNLIAAPCIKLYSNPSFLQFISIPRNLTITALWAADEDGEDFDDEDGYSARLQQFWTNHIINHILVSSNQQLESLHLTSPEFVQMPCGAITFPQLTTLSLSSVIFGIDGALERFILNHKSTLRHLTLDMCPVYHTEDASPPRFWFNIWDTFAEDLMILSFTLKTHIPYIFKDYDEWQYGRESLHHTHEGEDLPVEMRDRGDIIHKDSKALTRFRLAVKTQLRLANQR
ncbi:hypothetical protein C8J56DRAFT_989377 [Mycena floridula]|nr:hypothetical protein C8J56DRAFT_989377 [Mycena floridula]